MNAKKIMDELNLEDITKLSNKKTVTNAYIGDLLSLVMSKAKENSIWITIQTHLNIIAVAELVDIACIVIVENMEIDKDTISKAKELDIPIFKTSKSAYDVAKDLSKLGI